MGQFISITAADGHTFSAYVAGSPEAPHALVVVQEIFGVNHNMRAVADAWAADGFSVIVPALFDRVEPDAKLGYTPEDVQKGLALRADIPLESTLADLEACARHLREQAPERKVGIIGFCWGGRLAWDGATRTTAFSAAVGWYGGGIAAHKDATPHCAVQLHFGGQDGSIPPSDVSDIRKTHPEIEIYVYDEAGHGFGNRDRPSFNADAEHLARERSLTFLEAGLRTVGDIPERG
ncbi:carboxymethylenebutenolidase [Acetobacter nitrogenifigens DSM 23921 = NBRC 105050]|uniref:Carboxymethylenebutenolidase n=1 Tax=Acetobacter nitrogenifigens DSM 23921 = NBRC 105050 TaxID=1120919 RepID=A0A511XCF4_9PROT|nr:dienelactone hydrolase family protein [Acetobacter nitrogenifigens]GBQ92191.1 carboxymethylenebutenolidase [Acetobacter nitrogenifigens DSM 23921 = NBRC 105050]GEN60653.1 carboxymethylenebutenolidase [Acetobacter nitrogenifigens DSM 23921 = NBRC 105050]